MTTQEQAAQDLIPLAKMLAEATALAETYPEDVFGFVRDLSMTGLMMRDDRRNSWTYNTLHELLFDLGTPTKAPLALPDGFEVMEMQQCYRNAFELACEDETLTYCEGLALCSMFPVHHAWVVTNYGRIIDPTWSRFADDHPHAYYLGVKFDRDYLIQHAHENGLISFFGGDDVGDYVERGFAMEDDTAIMIGEL